MKLATQARQIVNEGLFVYALSVAVAHRDDCRGITLPPIQEVFPDRFIPSETINLALKEAKNKYYDVSTLRYNQFVSQNLLMQLPLSRKQSYSWDN